MSQSNVKISKPHPAFHRAMSDVSFYLSVAIVFCPDEFTMKELIGAYEGIGKLYKDLLDKISVNDENASAK